MTKRNISDLCIRVDFTEKIDCVLKIARKESEKSLFKKRNRPNYAYFDENISKKIKSGSDADGDFILQNIRKVLAEMSVVRSDDQISFQEEMLRSTAEGIYGKAFYTQFKRILNQNGDIFL